MTNTADTNDGVQVTNVDGAQSADVNLSLEDGKATKPADPNVPTAETLGVSTEQFAKYYDAAKGYNWQAHAKEAEFKTQQQAEKDISQEGVRDIKLAPGTGDAAPSDSDAQTAVEAAGLDFTALENKIIADGDIGKEDYDALMSIGIPEEVVKGYIDTTLKQVTDHVTTVIDAFGGKDGYDKIAEFAQANYSSEEIAALETQLADPKQYKLATELLLTKAGLPPVEKGSAVSGPNQASPSATGAKPFENQNEMVAQIRDPRYKTDTAFRKGVEARAGASTFGTNPRAHTAGL